MKKVFQLDNLPPNSSYSIRARAVFSDGTTSEWSKLYKLNVKGDDAPPPPITNLTGSYDSNSVQGAWDYDEYPDDFSGFQVTVADSTAIGDYYPSEVGTFSVAEDFSYNITVPPNPPEKFVTIAAIFYIPGQGMPDPQEIESLFPPPNNDFLGAITSQYPTAQFLASHANTTSSVREFNDTIPEQYQQSGETYWAIWYNSDSSQGPTNFLSVGYTGANIAPPSTTFDTGRNQSFSLDYVELITLFNSPPGSLDISVIARDNAGNTSSPVSITLESEPLPDPTNVLLSSTIAGYNVSWDEITQAAYNYTRIYESDSESGTYTLVYTSSSTPTFVPSTNYTPRYIKVSHVNTGGVETNLVASVPTNVTPENPNVLDTDPPDQRTSISFSGQAGAVQATWVNPTSEENNSDLAGISIRYAKTSSPTNYTWVSIPFTFAAPLTSTLVEGLLPNTSYEFSLATFDKTQNYTSYSTEETVVTLSDDVPPPAPKAPVAAGGSTSGGPFIIRITQESIENGTTNPLPEDTAYFKIFMLDSGITTAPASGIDTDDNATQIGTLIAAFNGGESQDNFYVPLTDGEQRYFYTRAVDTSSNISGASPASESTEMTVIDNAYISDLSADKITAGRLNANEYIQVGTSSQQITIKSTPALGQIYSGTGVYGTDDLYLDTSGKFSLKNRLAFDGTDLSIEGNITATGGSFTGNVGIGAFGGLYIGADPSSGPRIVLNNTSIGGYSNETGNPQTFLFTTLGTSSISGWSINPNTIEKANGGVSIKLDSANSQITAGSGTDTAGIKSDLSGEIAIWAGSETGTTSSPFYVTNSGFLKATNAEISGKITGAQGIFTGEQAVPGTTLNLVGGGAHTPTLTIDSGSALNDSSYLAMLRRVGVDHDAAIEFYTEQSSGNAYRRGRISHDGGDGGELIISSYGSSTGNTPGRLSISSEDSPTGELGEIYLDASRTFTRSLFVTQPASGDYLTEITTNFWKDPDDVSDGSKYFQVGQDGGSSIEVRRTSSVTSKVKITDYEIAGISRIVENSKVTIENVSTGIDDIQIGRDVGGTDRHGLYINSNNYWTLNDSGNRAQFRVGGSGKYLLFDQLTDTLTLSGSVTAQSFSTNIGTNNNNISMYDDGFSKSDVLSFQSNTSISAASTRPGVLSEIPANIQLESYYFGDVNQYTRQRLFIRGWKPYGTIGAAPGISIYNDDETFSRGISFLGDEFYFSGNLTIDGNLTVTGTGGGGGDTSPTGSIIMYGGDTAPSGWLFCDGTAVSRTTYSALFAVLGTSYGFGNGSTTFNLPNFTSRFPRQGTNRDAARGNTGGQDSFTLTESNIPQHSHGVGTLELTGSSGGSGALSHTGGTMDEKGGHTHSGVTGSTSQQNSHSHGPGTLSTNNAGAHTDTNTTYSFGTNSNTSGGGGGNRLTAATSVNSNQSVNSHSHSVNSGSTALGGAHDHTVSFDWTNAFAGAHKHNITLDDHASHTHGAGSFAITGSTGNWGTASPSSINNQPPYLVVNFIIKT